MRSPSATFHPSGGFWMLKMYNYRSFEPDQLEYISVATVDEIGDGERMIFEIGDRSIVLFNIAGGYFAIDDVCSHDDGPVAEGEIEDHAIECPRHGARFDLSSGKALTLPAVVDIGAYPVRVDGEKILIGLPLE
jgi:3-phenylpropionate/trans-cinnamate dioxygenase ferredoxin subunit